MKFSLVIPCYNESLNLPALINKCAIFSEKKDYELIFVDNGSTDNTNETLKKLIGRKNNFRFIRVEKNIGYGNGIIAGLNIAKGEILGWTHADLQTDPADAIEGLKKVQEINNPKNIFIKGKRYGRPFFDIIFTLGMSFFETILLGKLMNDINAQPTLFHRDFFLSWKDPPNDFSLDLYAYFLAKKKNFKIIRFDVFFGKRLFGKSHWNFSIKSKMKFIRRTLNYSFSLKKTLK